MAILQLCVIGIHVKRIKSVIVPNWQISGCLSLLPLTSRWHPPPFLVPVVTIGFRSLGRVLPTLASLADIETWNLNTSRSRGRED